MGLSFHDKPSLVEAVGSLRFAANDPNPRTGSISEDGSLPIGPHDSNTIPELEIRGIKEEGRDDDIGGSHDIQTVDR
jgi:hypothetical protein